MCRRAREYLEFGGLVSVVLESQRMVGKELEEWWGINLGSDRISAIGRGSQELNNIYLLQPSYLSLRTPLINRSGSSSVGELGEL